MNYVKFTKYVQKLETIIGLRRLDTGNLITEYMPEKRKLEEGVQNILIPVPFYEKIAVCQTKS